MEPSPGRVEIKGANRLKPFKNGSQGKKDETNEHEQGRKFSQDGDGNEPAKQTQDGKDERNQPCSVFRGMQSVYLSCFITPFR